MKKDIAIIIVNWNQKNITSNCINSLLVADSSEADIILVDNGSKDGSVSFLRDKFSHSITLIENNINTGFTGGNNIGVKYALEQNYKYVLFLNNDTEVRPGFSRPMKQLLDSNESIGACTGKVYFLYDRNRIWAVGGVFNKWHGKMVNKGIDEIDDGQYNDLIDVDYISGCMFLCRSSVLRKIGSFDDRFFAYYEDFDLSMRIKKKGYRLVYIPDSVIYHIAGVSGKEVIDGNSKLKPFIWYLTTKNHLFSLKKYAPFIFKYFLVSGYISVYLAYSLYFILKGDSKKASAILSGILKSFKM